MLACCLFGLQLPLEAQELKTFCNPVNLSYRFCLDEPSRREAADPSIVWFRDRYFLFASKSGGYWHSKDLTDWTFIETTEIPIEEYAPTAIALDDTLYFLASSREKSTIYRSADPLSGSWSVAVEELEMPVWDPAFFQDEDGRLYLYWGCSNADPLYGVEVDPAGAFSFIGEPKALIYAHPDRYGWEVPGDYNTLTAQPPWIEGAWMNRHNGKYYLQYAGPGTEFKSYADGVYVGDHPLGPFRLQPHNPFAYRPEGFAAGAGHGSTVTDPYGNYWHIGTISISQKHMFERRLGLYPTFFDGEGTMYAVTKFGDYPLVMPKKKVAGFDEIFPGWMLLSYGKTVAVSSAIDTLPPTNMTDEDIRTYWAAASGDPGEYAVLDLGQNYDVYAVQINFAEHDAGIFGREKNLAYRYTIDYSGDGTNWKPLIDKSRNRTDNSHDYVQLPAKVACRYLKISNLKVPGGHFAISGFRVFGKGNGEVPAKISEFTARRDPDNRRSIKLSWRNPGQASGYHISYGLDKNRLYQHYQLYRDTTLTINTLDAGRAYFFSIEAFNENGISERGVVMKVE